MNVAMKNPMPRASLALGLALGLLLPLSSALAQAPKVGPNVNMVSGTRFPEGDPFLTKQNEPSIAVSSRNPRHLLAASNDYRQVQVLTAEGLKGGKAWNTLYKSVDGGTSWRSVVLGGCPLNIAACNDPLTADLKALAPDFSADPTVRAGPHGTFFYSFIAGRRDGSTDGVVAVQRFVDKNNDIQRDTDVRKVAVVPGLTGAQEVLFHAEDPILPDKLTLIDRGTTGQFIDKPWNAADVGGRTWNGTGTCDLLSWTNQPGMDAIVGQSKETVPAFSVYVSYAIFHGQAANNDHPTIYVAASNDCGNTFSKPVKISNSLDATSGTSMAIDPLTGTVYVVWRRFGGLESPAKPDEIYMNKSTDGGKTWLNQPVLVTSLIPYDQGATSASFRTLAFPSVAVSVKGGVSRVHVTYTSRNVRPNATAPYACPAADPRDCDARVRIATSSNGGTSWTKKEVDPITASPGNPNGRGHQLQPAMTFAAGKLAITWLDQRFDQTEEVLTCPTGGCNDSTKVTDLVRTRVPMGNLDPTCSIDLSDAANGGPLKNPFNSLTDAQRALLGGSPGACYEYRSGRPASVWTAYLTDGTPGLVRRHTIDVFAALGDPQLLAFSSAPVSQYLFGVSSNGTNTAIRQKEVFAPNLPLFVSGTAAFIGDYIDMAGQTIVATGPGTYKFNTGAGCSSSPCFTTGGPSPVFHVAFTDNRDVIPPLNGDWAQPACLATEFTGDPANPTNNFGACATPGFAGNRNQNVRAAIVAADSVAYAYSNSKLLSNATPRGFVITVENLGEALADKSYRMTVSPPTGVTASFDKASFDPPASPLLSTVEVTVQPRSSATRSLWLVSTIDSARVVVQVTSPPGCTSGTAGCYFAEVPLNPDPGARGSLVTNGDNTPVDTANNDIGSVVLSNAVLTNNVLSNNALSNDALGNAVLSNKALTNAALSNVVLSNLALSNLQVEELNPATTTLDAIALSNAVLTNKALSNVVLTNRALSNLALSNNVLSNVALTNLALTNLALSNAVLDANALSNLALTNLDPANLALSNAVLSNNALSNLALSNKALSNVVLTNAALTNAVLTNVVLSNKALSNNALSNNSLEEKALSNKALSNKVLSNSPVDDDLRTVEAANFDLGKNAFTSADVDGRPFADATFTMRNRSNTDTTLAVKLLLADPVLFLGAPATPSTPAIPPKFKLQLVMRKVVPVPTAIAPTGPATQLAEGDNPLTSTRALRIGLTQFNAQVSNVGTPEVIDINDPDAEAKLGKFLPAKSDAATLPLAPGERAHVTLRAIAINGQTDADPFDFLRWGSKFVVVDAARPGTTIPLIIKTLSFPAAATAGQSVPTIPAVSPDPFTVKTAGGFGNLIGDAVCADRLGTPVSEPGFLPGTPCILLATLSFASGGRDGVLAFTPPAKGEFYLRVKVTDQSVPPQEDQQLLKVVVNLATPVISGFPPTNPALPTTLVFGQPLQLPALVASPGAPVPYYSTTGPCSVNASNVLSATGTGDCVISANSNETVVYAAVHIVAPTITITKAAQTITVTPPTTPIVYSSPTKATVTLNASASSGMPVSFASTTPAICTVSGNVATIQGAGNCSITVGQDGDTNYLPAPTVPPTTISFTVGKSPQTITVTAPAQPIVYSASPRMTVALQASASSALAVSFASTTPAICTVSGNIATIVAAGDCSVAVSQDGDGNYLAAPSLPITFPVGKSSQTITFTRPADIFYGATASVPLVATASSALGVSFALASGSTGCSVSGSTATISGAGTCTITATQAGDSNFNAATAVTLSFTIAKASQTVTFGALGGKTLGDAPFTVSATASTSLPVTFTAALASICTVAGNTVTLTGVGDCTITATQGGNANYNLASSVRSFTVSKASQTINFVALAERFLSDPPFTVSATATSGLSVSFTSLTLPVCTVSGSLVTLVGAGTCTIAADQAGNASYAAAPQVTRGFKVSGFVATGPMVQTRSYHTATLLSDGRVLVAGGFNSAGASTDTSEIYTPSTGKFTAAGNLPSKSAGHTATLLNDGRVLAAGGGNSSTEIFSPSPTSGTWSQSGGMGSTRSFHSATKLSNGTVLLAGGADNAGKTIQSTIVFNPATGTFSNGPLMVAARERHAATLLPSGKVLITGGRQKASNAYTALKTAELCDAASCIAVTGAMNQARYGHSVESSSVGLLVVGGADPASTAPTVVELFTGDGFATVTSTTMRASRRDFAVSVLPDNRLLVTGGVGSTGAALQSSELFGGTFIDGAKMVSAHANHRSTRLPDGRVLVTGGIGPTGTATNAAELFVSAP